MKKNHPYGKGDSRRPMEVPQEVFNSNWDAIFPPKKPIPTPESTRDVVIQPTIGTLSRSDG